MRLFPFPTLPTLILALSLGVAAFAQEGNTDLGLPDKASFPKPPYSPYAGRDFPTRPYFGDTHLHTSFSFDAGMVGCRLGPSDAYRFAKGQEVTTSTGQRAKLSRPLDFLVVADHSDNLGLAPDFAAGKPELLADAQARHWFEMTQSGKAMEAALEVINAFSTGKVPQVMRYTPDSRAFRSAWQEILKAAEGANDPGRFTAFIGYEWTSMPGGNNLHRNVIFRDDASKAGLVVPFTTEKPLGSDDPRDLWKWMAAYEEKTGGDVLAIAHNGNLSGGLMFPMIEPGTGRPLDREYARQREMWERLFEIIQTKGSSETHPLLSPNDEFADYEIWDKGNVGFTAAQKPEMYPYEYARSAFKNGLKLQGDLGINPFKFGLVGSTDAHNALAAVEEENFFGKATTGEPAPHRWDHVFMKNDAIGKVILTWETTSAGYAAVWATDNTREALFDAMQRRETYGTSGPRMVVRFFGGWDFTAKDATNRMPARVGYTKGVPMGGDLAKAPAGKSPTFLVAALKDPIGANLDRIQVIKGWQDAKGELHERIYDVAVSDGRAIGPDGRCKTSVGSTVDVAQATWTNTIGAPELIACWKDPDFDPSQRAFYYARVLEIPTPRWTAYDAARFGVKMPPEVPMTTVERGYTSPIWYTP